MRSDNSVNTEKGRLFQEQVGLALTKHYGVEFLMDHPIVIGHLNIFLMKLLLLNSILIRVH